MIRDVTFFFELIRFFARFGAEICSCIERLTFDRFFSNRTKESLSIIHEKSYGEANHCSWHRLFSPTKFFQRIGPKDDTFEDLGYQKCLAQEICEGHRNNVSFDLRCVYHFSVKASKRKKLPCYSQFYSLLILSSARSAAFNLGSIDPHSMSVLVTRFPQNMDFSKQGYGTQNVQNVAYTYIALVCCP